jgi:diacylglycerol kinase
MGLSRIEWAILALVVGLVLAAEWLNTAAEATVDLVTAKY